MNVVPGLSQLRAVALDDGAEVDPGRERAQRTAVVTVEACRTECVRNHGITVPDQDRRLQCDPHALDDPPKLAKTAKSREEALAHYRRVRDEIKVFVMNLPASLAHVDSRP